MKILACQVCGYKKVCSEEELKSLPFIKRANLQTTLPSLEQKEIKSKNQNVMYKCDKCGRGVTAKEHADPQMKIDEDNRIIMKKDLQEKMNDLRQRSINGV